MGQGTGLTDTWTVWLVRFILWRACKLLISGCCKNKMLCVGLLGINYVIDMMLTTDSGNSLSLTKVTASAWTPTTCHACPSSRWSMCLLYLNIFNHVMLGTMTPCPHNTDAERLQAVPQRLKLCCARTSAHPQMLSNTKRMPTRS